MAIAIKSSCRIVCHCNGRHVFIGSCPQLCKPIDFYRTGIWDQDDFSPLQHEDTCTFGKLTIIANHGPNSDSPLCRIQFSDVEIVSCRQSAFITKIACVNFCIDKNNIPKAINQTQGISRQRFVSLKKRHADGHFQFFCKFTKRTIDILPPLTQGDSLLR